MLTYRIVEDDDLTPDQVKRLDDAAKEAEAGYTEEQLARARTLAVNPITGRAVPGGAIVVPLDEADFGWLEDYAKAHHMTGSEAMRSFMEEKRAKEPTPVGV